MSILEDALTNKAFELCNLNKFYEASEVFSVLVNNTMKRIRCRTKHIFGFWDYQELNRVPEPYFTIYILPRTSSCYAVVYSLFTINCSYISEYFECNQ